MTFLEWRRFNFFQVERDVDSGKVRESLKDKKILTSSSGNGNLVFGDSEGSIHLVTRGFNVTTINAFELRVCLVQMMQHSPLIVAIGEDEPGINPLIKVWNLEKLDKQGLPMCVRISRTIPNNRPTPVSTICVHENLNLMAVGFTDGSILLYRGDIARDRLSKHKVLRDGGMLPVTGLAFRSTAKQTFLFVATVSSVFSYNITTKDKEEKIDLDKEGCERNCSTSTESTHDGQFMIGREDAVYCYTADGRGPCYAFKGIKVMLEWYRNYLVIVTKENKSVTRASTATSPTTPDTPGGMIGSKSGSETHMVTVLDIQNKFIVLQTPMQDVISVLSEWGSLYVLSGQSDPCLFHFQEKDLQSKLGLLFKKNLYDVAIRIAKSNQYDADGLTDIFREYGDHLYANKGDHAGAIEQYIKTIGRLEPSYVIRKFLDSQHIENLTTYLQELHKHGHATEDHTTLLLNCYTKLDKTDKLKEFIMTKDREVDFDVEIAIKVCRQASTEDALLLAQKHKMHDWYLKIQIEDQGDCKQALDYIGKLDFSEAETNMKKYGCILLQNCPNEATQLLKRLCTDYRPSNKPLVDNNMLQGNINPLVDRANPADFIHLFTECPKHLEEFLEYLLQEHTEWNPLLYNTLLEHYLNSWGTLASAGTVETSRRLHYEQNIMRLLQNPDSRYDKDQVLILCQANNFRPGVLHLLEENHLYQQILQYHMIQRDYKEVLSTCQRFGKQDHNLWVQALWYCARDSHTPADLLEEILLVIEKDKSLPPLLVLDALCTSSDVTLANVRSYLLNVLTAESKLARREQELVQKYHEESDRIRQQIRNIQTKSMIFQVSRCSACNQPLELPSIHFLCQHSYHQHCFHSFSENENECPSCLPNNKKILDVIKAREQTRDLHETFHDQLNKAEDGFSLVADYFGRGVFNKLTVVTDTPIPMLQKSTLSDKTNSSTGAGAEARLRIAEQPSSFRGQVGMHNQPQSNFPATSATSRTAHISPSQVQTDFAALSVGSQNSSPKFSPYTPKLYETRQEASGSSVSTKGKLVPPISRVVQPKINPVSVQTEQTSKNPFEDEDDDSTNPFSDAVESTTNSAVGQSKSKPESAAYSTNPFGEEEDDDPTNPFDEPDDYDKEKNPFGCS
ncbi:vacuolar protein sorting-associated protein 11 homolog [Frankliniella occidentalis]|uniref:Vacuolar protein sorting-associated protein 11 homolog n=1 Tax=Frankliniella occidentalis TaxID=133901 RepID=A0A6J1TB99_FRAOC|nr:vacuolar protein sorting-associated protein 11 homolog [Frankliniella occidentalis]